MNKMTSEEIEEEIRQANAKKHLAMLGAAETEDEIMEKFNNPEYKMTQEEMDDYLAYKGDEKRRHLRDKRKEEQTKEAI